MLLLKFSIRSGTGTFKNKIKLMGIYILQFPQIFHHKFLLKPFLLLHKIISFFDGVYILVATKLDSPQLTANAVRFNLCIFCVGTQNMTLLSNGVNLSLPSVVHYLLMLRIK